MVQRMNSFADSFFKSCAENIRSEHKVAALLGY